MSGDLPSSRGAPKAAAAVITERAGVRPRVGVVLGSGLGTVADAVSDPTVIPYAELPGFPRPTVAGHGGRAVLGELGGLPVAVLQGRAHVSRAATSTPSGHPYARSGRRAPSWS